MRHRRDVPQDIDLIYGEEWDEEEPLEDWDASPRRPRKRASAGGSRSSTGTRGRYHQGNPNQDRYQGRQRDWDRDPSRYPAQDRYQDQYLAQGRYPGRARYSDRRGSRKPRRRGGLKKFFLKLLLVLLLLLSGVYFLVHQAYSKVHYHEIESLVHEPLQEKGVANILLIGNDSRENGEDGRSDAMILLSVSMKNKEIAMTSLLRDMYVEIPGHKGNRLNAAYSYGGAELLMETIEENLGITVNRYVQVNFEAFANLVDAVGGVDLELSSGEKELVNGYLNEYNDLTGKEFGTDYLENLEDGVTHLNGPQALAYTRNRYIGTDFGRTERQRKVLAEVMSQLPKALLHPAKLSEGMLPNLTTNLTEWECYEMTLASPFVIRFDREHGSIPLDGTYRDASIRGMSVLEVDFEENKRYLYDLLYQD